jgi:hypothetical protein
MSWAVLGSAATAMAIELLLVGPISLRLFMHVRQQALCMLRGTGQWVCSQSVSE